LPILRASAIGYSPCLCALSRNRFAAARAGGGSGDRSSPLDYRNHSHAATLRIIEGQ